MLSFLSFFFLATVSSSAAAFPSRLLGGIHSLHSLQTFTKDQMREWKMRSAKTKIYRLEGEKKPRGRKSSFKLKQTFFYVQFRIVKNQRLKRKKKAGPQGPNDCLLHDSSFKPITRKTRKGEKYYLNTRHCLLFLIFSKLRV